MTALAFQVRGLEMSGREARPEGRPRGLVLALPGGGYLSGYWDYPGGSLLELAATRGFRAVAIDRPGYGAAYGHPCDLAAQAEIILDVIDEFVGPEGNSPVLLAGHSLGGILALMIGASPRARKVTAIDVSGVPLVFAEASRQFLTERKPAPGQVHYDPLSAEHVERAFFGPAGTFDPAAQAYHQLIAAPLPVAEHRGLVEAADTLPLLMPQIRMPIRYTIAEFEATSIADAAVAARAAELLSGSARAEVRVQPGCGHNISLHHVAAEFHAGMLDWFEDVS